MMGRVLRWILVGAGLLFLAVQVVPYGRRHTNPPVRVEPSWDSAETRAIAVRGLLRLSQQRDRLALVLARRARLMAEPA